MADRQPFGLEHALRRLAAWGANLRRGQAVSVKPSDRRFDQKAVDEGLSGMGTDGERARRLDTAAEQIAERIVTLSPLTSGLALDYIDRLGRPIPSLTPEVGVEIVTLAYAARLAMERDPAAFGADGHPHMRLPPLKRGRPPQDILTRTVKASRRGFPAIRAVPSPVWEGYVLLLTRRVHRSTPDADQLVAMEVVDGLARFGWVLRQVDIRYNLEPDLKGQES